MQVKYFLITSAICFSIVKSRDNVDAMADLFYNQQYEAASSNGESSHQAYKPGVDVRLENHRNGYYTGEIVVGTAASEEEEQRFTVIFDTGSIDLWIPSKEACLSGAVRCDLQASHTGYDASKSSTFQGYGDPYTTMYGDGFTVKGQVASDVLKIASGDSALLVPEFKFGVVDTAKLDRDTADGVFGLSFGLRSALKGVTESPFESMIRQANIRPQFGFFFNDKFDQNDKKFGHLFLGGYDEKLVDGDFMFVKLFRNGLSYMAWEFLLDGVTVAGSPLVHGVGVKTLVDSGTNTIRVPTKLLDTMYNKIPNEYTLLLKENSFECDSIDRAKLPKVAFKINNTPFELDPDDYIEESHFFDGKNLPKGHKSRCFFLIREIPSILNRDLIILGIPFMIKYYTLFDMGKKQIGFARAKHGLKVSSFEDNAVNGGKTETTKSKTEKTNIVSDKSKQKHKHSKSKPHSVVSGKDTAPFFESGSIIGRLLGGSSRR